MLFKKLIVFGLCLFSVCSLYASQITDKEQEQTQQKQEIKEFCHYDISDFRGSSKYDAQSDEIVIENCILETGFDCSSYKISKLAEFDGVKIYYSSEHPDNVFINDNGVWKWKDAGCNFEDQIPEVLKEEAELWKKSGFKLEYAGKYKLPSGEYAYFYVTVAPEGTLTGFPTVYEIINNEIYLEISDSNALDILAKVGYFGNSTK